MDAALLAAIQKGRGLKKSPRRPSMARRASANAGNAPAAKVRPNFCVCGGGQTQQNDFHNLTVPLS